VLLSTSEIQEEKENCDKQTEKENEKNDASGKERRKRGQRALIEKKKEKETHKKD